MKYKLYHFINLTFIYVSVINAYEKRVLKSTAQSSNDGKVEYSGIVTSLVVSTKYECTSECLTNSMCVSYFYNAVSKQCLLHSTDLRYSNLTVTEQGWKHYVKNGGSARCPIPYMYYRQLDFCYRINEIEPIDFSIIKTNCASDGGRLAALTSQERQNYITSVLANRPILRVCIGGNKQQNLIDWELDDGSPLTYFNWASTDPDGGSIQMCLIMFTSDEWLDARCAYNNTCIYICEV